MSNSNETGGLDIQSWTIGACSWTTTEDVKTTSEETTSVPVKSIWISNSNETGGLDTHSWTSGADSWTVPEDMQTSSESPIIASEETVLVPVKFIRMSNSNETGGLDINSDSWTNGAESWTVPEGVQTSSENPIKISGDTISVPMESIGMSYPDPRTIVVKRNGPAHGKLTCDLCQHTFSTKYYIKTHMRIHTNETPYTCTICNKSYR